MNTPCDDIDDSVPVSLVEPGVPRSRVWAVLIGSLLAACGGDPSGPGPTGGPGGPFSQPRSVVFASDRDGDFDIYAMYEDGSDVVQLTNLPGDEHRPRWSPDGEWIAFDHSTTSSIYRMRGDGTGLEELWGGFAPAWSPDGDEIAYSGGSTLEVRRLDGSQQRTVTFVLLGVGEMDWSRDGRIAFTAGVAGLLPSSWEVALIDADADRGTGTLWAIAGGPSWSPDGTRLAVAIPDIRVWDVPATGATPLMLGYASNGSTAWSSAGNELIISSSDDIHRIALDGGTPVQLTMDAAHDWEPDWR